MEIFWGVVTGLIALTVLVVLHELGHAIVARRNGVIVEEFGIGFPPRAWAKKLSTSILGKHVEYSVNWLPLGGFVRLQGENDSARGKGDYGAATFWQKTRILLAGVAINWVTAAVLLSILALFGLPKVLPNQFSIPSDSVVSREPIELTYIGSDMPASQAGLQVGDKILRFDGEAVADSQTLVDLAKDRKGEKVEVIYSRKNVEKMTSVTLRKENNDAKGFFGASSAQRESIRSSWSAPIVGVGVTAQFTVATFQGLGDMIANAARGFVLQFSGDSAAKQEASQDLARAGDGVTGPVGIFGVIFPAANRAGFSQVVLLTAIISLSLAVMNALPIPALDGGRWFVTALFRLMKKPLSKEREEKIHGTGFLFLMGLILLVTLLDVTKLTR